MTRWITRWLASWITLVGVGCGAVAAASWIEGRAGLAFGVWWLGVLADQLDGPVARRLGTASSRGALLDGLGDLSLYGMAPFALCYAAGTYGMFGGLLLLGGLAWRLAADLDADAKGVHLGAAAIGVVTLSALVGPLSPVLALALGALCAVWSVLGPCLPVRARPALVALGGVGWAAQLWGVA